MHRGQLNDALLDDDRRSGYWSPNAYAYVGTARQQVQVGDSMDVATNLRATSCLPQAKCNRLIAGLITALQTGTTLQSRGNHSRFHRLNYVAEQRIPLDNTIGQLNDQESYLGRIR